MNRKIIIGTRASQLALWQADFVKNEILSRFPDMTVEIKHVKTSGDILLNKPLSEIGGKGLFTKELENELLAGSIDIAVHSLKDLQTEIPEGLRLAAVTERQTVKDVLIARHKGTTIRDLPIDAVVATGSLRRRAQLLHLRPDFRIVDLRGNITTRIEKFLQSDWNGMVLAGVGIVRLNLQKYISSYINVDDMLPAVGQGALAVEASENSDFDNVFEKINHKETEIAARAERAFLAAMGGGCRSPIAAYAQIFKDKLIIDGLVASVDGKRVFRKKIQSTALSSPERIGRQLANLLMKEGAMKVIEGIVKSFGYIGQL